MAYVLVSWIADDDVVDHVRDALDTALTNKAGEAPIDLQAGLLLFRSKTSTYGGIRNKMEDVVRDFPGTEIIVIQVALGSDIGGWADAADFAAAKPYVNIGDRTIYPIVEVVT